MEHFKLLIIPDIFALSLHDLQPPKAKTRTNIPDLRGCCLFAYNVGPELA
jgi:hypothetical protein